MMPHRKDASFEKLTHSPASKPSPTQTSLADRIPTHIRNHLIAVLGEFVGTFMFLFFAFAGTQTANTPRSTTGSSSTTILQGPQPVLLLYISLSFSVSLAATVWIFFRVSGGQFNPAVTLALVLTDNLPYLRGLILIPTQLIASICSAYCVKYLFPGPLAVGTSLSAGVNRGQGIGIEMFLTTQLILTIFMLAVEKHRATYLAPLGIGMSLFMAEMAGVYYTGGSLNPARSFGPAVANVAWGYDWWVYWVGPAMGAVLASIIWKVLKVLRYEGANLGQDEGGWEDLKQSEEGTLTSRPTRFLRLNNNGSFGRPLSLPESVFDSRGAR